MGPITKRIFLEVCDLEPPVRLKRLGELCGNDLATLHEVELLLEHDRPESIFDSPDALFARENEPSFPLSTDDLPDRWRGRTIGNYRLLGRIGEGGMGEVYRAEDTRLKRIVAVKFLASHLLRDERQKRRFWREAQAAAALDHPSICQVHDVGEFQGRPYIVAAFIDGQNLAEVIQSSVLPVTVALQYVIQIAEGLRAAHRQGVVHRDVKPGNVIVASGEDGRPQVKIIDFGLARVSGSSSLTERGGVIGTAAYIAPEILRGHEVDHRADIWSLGVILYELLAGYGPFDAEDRERLFYRICYEDPAPLTGLHGSLPALAEQIVRRALEKDPRARYQDVRELLADLEELWREIPKEAAKGPAPNHAVGADCAFQTTMAPGRAPWGAPGRQSMLARAQSLTRRGGLLGFAVLALVAAAAFVRSNVYWGHSPTPTAFARIGVLPFEDLSVGGRNPRIGPGIEDALDVNLMGVKDVKVVPRSVVVDLHRRQSSHRDIIESLHLNYLVTGSVARSENILRATVNLVSGEDLDTLWSKTLDLQFTDLLKVQTEVAETVVAEMAALILAPKQVAAPASWESAAYDLFMKGQYSIFQYRSTKLPEFSKQAEQRLREALELNPDLVDASVAMAELRLIQLYPPSGDREELLSDAREWVGRVITKDPRHPKINRLLSIFYLESGDSVQGLEHARSAVRDSPDDGEAHYRLGLLYSAMGFFESAMAENEKAIAADSLTIEALSFRIWHSAVIGEFDEAELGIQRLSAFDPESYHVPLHTAGLEILRGHYEKALEIYDKDSKLRSRSIEYSDIGKALARAASGETDIGRAVVQKYASLEPRRLDDFLLLATLAGDAELMASLTRESPYFNNYRWVVGNPFIDKVKDQQAFRDLLFDLHKTWEANLARERLLLPVLPPALPKPEAILGGGQG